MFYDVRNETVEVLAIVTKRQVQSWLAEQGRRTRTVALAKVKDDFSRYLRLASEGEVVITRRRASPVEPGLQDLGRYENL